MSNKKLNRQEIDKLKEEIKNRLLHKEDELYEEYEDISSEEMAEELLKFISEKELEDYLEEIHTVDVAESMEEIEDDKELIRIFNMLSLENQVEIIEDADEDLQKRIIELLDVEDVIELFTEMSPDDIVDILGYINIYKSKEILNKMKRSEANKIRELLGYEEDTAGGIMTTEYIAFKSNLKVKDVIIKIKDIAPRTEYIDTIFVLDDKKELIATAELRDLLIADDQMLLCDIMEENVISVYPEEDQEEIAKLVSKYGLKVVPVINNKRNLLGIITIDDIIEVIQEENTEDILRLGGLNQEEELDTELKYSILKRLPWLIINLFTAFIASFTVGLFSDTISQVVVLAAAMPIVSGMGGNVGTQSLAVTIRAIALGEVDSRDNYIISIKYIALGFLNGAILGIFAGIIVYILYTEIYLSLIIFLSMIGNSLIACLVGYLIPITLKKMKIDPAMASSVILTTITDVCGFFLFLGLATLFIDKLS